MKAKLIELKDKLIEALDFVRGLVGWLRVFVRLTPTRTDDAAMELLELVLDLAHHCRQLYCLPDSYDAIQAKADETVMAANRLMNLARPHKID